MIFNIIIGSAVTMLIIMLIITIISIFMYLSKQNKAASDLIHLQPF